MYPLISGIVLGKATFVDGARTAAGLIYVQGMALTSIYRTGSGRRRSGITVSGGAAAPLCYRLAIVHPACVVDVWPVSHYSLLIANPADINE